MTAQPVESFAAGRWIKPDQSARIIKSAINGRVIARAGNSRLDYQEMLEFGRNFGGTALRAMTFHDRARMLKALATEIGKHKHLLYELSFDTGATQSDNLIDIDGGMGTMFVYASKGRTQRRTVLNLICL